MYASRIHAGALRNGIVAISAVLAVITSGASAQPAGNGWLTIDVPGAISTEAAAINGHHVIAGDYVTTGSVDHGFVRTPDGTLTPFDDPASTGSTLVSGINLSGTIVGRSQVAGGFAGFIRSSSGTFTPVSVPGTTVTLPTAINDSGVVTGVSEDLQTQALKAFVRTADGTITSFLPPDAIYTEALAINGKGAITGLYLDSGKAIHGFVRAANGRITAFDPPGSVSLRPTGINSKGEITGSYQDATLPNAHGFVREPDGTITTFDAPGVGTNALGTQPASIDFNGDIAGYYVDDDSTAHGFVRDTAGNFHKLDAPGATNTYAAMIGPTGKVVGFSDNVHGFRLNRHVWQNAGP